MAAFGQHRYMYLQRMTGSRPPSKTLPGDAPEIECRVWAAAVLSVEEVDRQLCSVSSTSVLSAANVCFPPIFKISGALLVLNPSAVDGIGNTGLK